MENIFGLNLNIDENYLARAVKDTVMMGISESLNGKNEIVSQIVNSVLTTKVDKHGKISSYSADNKYSILDFYVNGLITEEVKNEVKLICEERRPEIRKLIRKKLREECTAEKFVDKFYDCMFKNLDSTWQTNISVEFEKHKED